MNSVYLASPFFSPAQKERIASVVDALKQNKTIDPAKIFIPHEHEYKEAEFGSFEWQVATFQLDTAQIKKADFVVAILDYKMEEAGTNEADSGTMFEVGFAYANRIPVALVQFDPEKEVNLMLAQSLTAYFDASKNGLEELKTYDFDERLAKYSHRPVI